MDREQIRALLEAVSAGDVDTEAALHRLADLPFSDQGGFARVDTHRSLRLGLPEVIYGAGKRPEQVVGIARTLLDRGQRVLVTRIPDETAAVVQQAIPRAVWHEVARCITVLPDPPSAPREPTGNILIVTAGTSDIPVAEEARITAASFDNKVEALHDVGVSGIHRILGERQRLLDARVLIVVAGMEGALASVVGGLVPRPVIAVPTSVGYGASFGGLAALLAMLNSCAAGVSVVNIDNGFGAAYAATMINRLGEL